MVVIMTELNELGAKTYASLLRLNAP
jgi:hypothetical protein